MRSMQQESQRKPYLAKWKELGYKGKAWSISIIRMFSDLGSRGDGATYKASFFGKTQVEAIYKKALTRAATLIKAK